MEQLEKNIIKSKWQIEHPTSLMRFEEYAAFKQDLLFKKHMWKQSKGYKNVQLIPYIIQDSVQLISYLSKERIDQLSSTPVKIDTDYLLRCDGTTF